MQIRTAVKNIDKQRYQELIGIKEKNGGIIPPKQVVELAKDPDTALHSWHGWKGWDVDKAANEYFLSQARTLIRTVVAVEDVPGGGREKIRVFTNLISDRKNGLGGGYRVVTEVLNDEMLKTNMLKTALMELRAFQRKYEKCEKLVNAIGNVIAEVEG